MPYMQAGNVYSTLANEVPNILFNYRTSLTNGVTI